MPIRRVLVANRGEIAVRVIRTCEKLGLETVLCVSEADRASKGADMATKAVCIGPAQPAKSYLAVETIVQAALGYACDAIHPGYGFLSERADLAKLAEEGGMIFIGPTARQIESVGDKLRARGEAIAADVPVVPGGPVDTPEGAQGLAAEIGAPLLVKAVGGGGGRGMKLVEDLGDLAATMDLASAEAGAAFGDARVYLERYVEKGRHIEVQLLGDGEGRVVHLGERDCSVQRRYQKLVEESPAPHLPADTRARLLEAAVRFAERLDYRGAGTVEFLFDVERDEFYFLEMNARIQVEHPVTEMVAGTDLVAHQIAIADGRGLSLSQDEVELEGAAIEVRINAEDPDNNFMPSPGTVTDVRWPEGDGIRVDTHIESGSSIPPFYDAMIAKIIAWGPDRATALARLRRALDETHIEGIATNLVFQRHILADPDFAQGGVDTGFLARMMEKEPA